MTDTGITVQGNDHSLQSVLGYILSKEGLEQNLDISLNMTEEGKIPVQVITSNNHVLKLTSDFQELIQVNLKEAPYLRP